MFPKIVGFPPKSSILIGVFHYFHHPFWGIPIFGNTHIYYIFIDHFGPVHPSDSPDPFKPYPAEAEGLFMASVVTSSCPPGERQDIPVTKIA